MATGSEPSQGRRRRTALIAALPRLAGPGLAVFRLVWFLALAAAIVAPIGGAWLRWQRVATGMDAVSLAIDLLPPLLLVATAILLYLRRRRDTVATLLSLSFLLMSASFFAAEGFFRALELTWLRDLLAHAGRAALLLVLLAFPDGRFSPSWSAWVALALLVWAPFALLGPVPLDAEYLGYLAFLALAVLSIALPYRRLPGGLERQQVRWVLFGFAAGTVLLGLAVAVTFLPETASGPVEGTKSWPDLAAQLLAALGMACFALGLIVSLLRYRLYDADAVISRSAGYAALTLALGATFAITVKSIDALIEAYFGGEAGALPSVVGGGLAVALITPLNSRLQNWAERRFQKALLHLRRDLPDCVADLRETAGLKTLLGEVLARVEDGVRAVRSAVVIDGRTEAARGEPGGEYPVAVPLRIGHSGTEIGTLLVGPRPDGSLPGKDEREALGEIADPVARAVQIVRVREARERALDERLTTLERALESAPRRRGRPAEPPAGEAAE